MTNITELKQKEQNIREEMKKIYKENCGFWRTDIDSVYQAREKWFKLKIKADKIRDKIYEEEIKIKPIKKDTNECFINSYGEATEREITCSTYKRQQRKQEREMMNWLNR